MRKKYLLSSFILLPAIILVAISLFFVPGFNNIPITQASVTKLDVKPPKSSDISETKAEEERQREAMEIYNLGMQYSKSGQIDKAIEEYRHALEIDPNLAEAHLNLGWSYALKKKEYNIALQETLEAVRLKPDMPIAYRNLWWIYRLMKKYDKALETLKKLIKIEPDNALNYLNLGDAYASDSTDFDLAVQSYKKGLELDKTSIYIHRKLGKAYEFQKKYDLAISEYKKAIELNPTDSYSYLFLAVSLGKAAKQKEIPPLIKEAYETISKDVPMPDRWDLDLLKFYGGEISEEELFKKAELNPIYKCQALYYSGLKYIWEGNKAKGIEFLEQAQSMEIDSLSEYEYVKTELNLLNK